jgi:peptide/nickel transport system substrate-binding protein
MSTSRVLSRRRVLAYLGGAGGLVLLAACAPAAPASPTAAAGAAPANTPAPAAPAAGSALAPTNTPAPAAAAAPTTAAATPTAAAAPGLTQLPRNQTLVMGESDAVNQFTDSQIMNPFQPAIARSGWQIAFEPLFFYDMWWTDQTCGPPGFANCKNGEIPWQAESYSYNADYTQLIIKLRGGITWSDGQQFTSSDVAYTLNMLRDNAPKLNFSSEMKQWVKEAVALDPLTAQVTLNSPNPRFMFNYLTWHTDLGFPILPEHIFKSQDPTIFTNFDINKGWPITTGPFKLTLSSLEQKFWDRRDDWWAAKSGFHQLPAMKRVIMLPNFTDEKQLELITANQIECAHGFQDPSIIQTALTKNPKIQVWTANNDKPYGAVDIATVTSLSFNCSKPPFDDPDIRWAINHALNRDEILATGAHGIGAKVVLPFPRYGALAQYYDASQDILTKYPIDAFDLAKSAQLMQSKGYAKDSGGFWAKDGKRWSWVIVLPPPFFTDITPVIVVQLRKAGFDVSFKSAANEGTLLSTGDVDAYLQVPGGSVRDPYETMDAYNSRWSAPNGQPAVRSYRWKNDAYDAAVNELAKTSPTDPKLVTVFHSAMEILLRELPMIPLLQRYLFVPVNTTYWTGWPNEKNPYTVPTSWHRSANMFILSLKPTGG